MKGEKTLRLLEILAEAGRTSGEFFSAFFTDYHTSYRMLRGMQKRMYGNYPSFPEPTRHQFYNLLSSLKRDGLAQSKNNSWKITTKGKRLWRALRKKLASALPEPSYPSAPPAPRRWNIVVFDIPEHSKRKRVWLRAALKRLGFTMLQKSVWIGNAALPIELLRDLDSLGLLPYIHILAVTKTGSLKHIGSPL